MKEVNPKRNEINSGRKSEPEYVYKHKIGAPFANNIAKVGGYGDLVL